VATFVGGPCDGQTVPATSYPQAICGGVTYLQHEDGNYYSPDAGGGTVGTAALGTHAPKGWADIQKAINHHLPTSLRRSQVYRRATLRTLARRRRVR
jgi:hypothetical protein